MLARAAVVGGEVSLVCFGITYVEIKGFSNHNTRVLDWIIRLDKTFHLLTGTTEQAVKPGSRGGEELLAALPSKGVVDLTADKDGLRITFDNGFIIYLPWEESERACANIDVMTSDADGQRDLALSLLLPDEISSF